MPDVNPSLKFSTLSNIAHAGYGTAYGEHGHLATAVVGNLVFLLAEASILDLTGLVVRRLEAVLASLSIDFIGVHVRKLLGGGNFLGKTRVIITMKKFHNQLLTRKPCSTEEGNVGEETDGGTSGVHRVVRNETGEDEDHGQALADSTVEDREVVDDSVAARQLLHELRAGAEHHTTEVLSLATSEKGLGRSLLTETTSSLDGIEKDASFKLDFRIICGFGVESCENDCSFVLTIVREKPSRRLGQSCRDNKDDDSENDLESDGESPGQVVRTVAAAEIDPVSDERADSDIATFNTDDFASVVSLRTLGLQTYTCDETSNDKLCSTSCTGANAADLDDDTNDHGDTADEDSPATAEFVAELENEDSTAQTTDSVDGDNETLPATVVTSLGEHCEESITLNDTRHDTLVITEEKKIGSGDGVRVIFPVLSSSTGKWIVREGIREEEQMLAELWRWKTQASKRNINDGQNSRCGENVDVRRDVESTVKHVGSCRWRVKALVAHMLESSIIASGRDAVVGVHSAEDCLDDEGMMSTCKSAGHVEYQVFSTCHETVSPVELPVLQEIIAHGRFCFVSRKCKLRILLVSCADNDRQTSVVEPDLQTA
ncbi:general substrate transporter, partial [Aureobasidium melanogenum]